jgi:hypothetical protein
MKSTGFIFKPADWPILNFGRQFVVVSIVVSVVVS